MPKNASLAQALSDNRGLYGGRLLLNCNKISRPGEGKRANGAGHNPKLMSFPRRRESMGRIGSRLGLGLELGLLRAGHNGCSHALWIPAFAGMTASDRLCVCFEVPVAIPHFCVICF